MAIYTRINAAVQRKSNCQSDDGEDNIAIRFEQRRRRAAGNHRGTDELIKVIACCCYLIIIVCLL